jgi:hypothetical protein
MAWDLLNLISRMRWSLTSFLILAIWGKNDYNTTTCSLPPRSPQYALYNTLATSLHRSQARDRDEFLKAVLAHTNKHVKIRNCHERNAITPEIEKPNESTSRPLVFPLCGIIGSRYSADTQYRHSRPQHYTSSWLGLDSCRFYLRTHSTSSQSLPTYGGMLIWVSSSRSRFWRIWMKSSTTSSGLCGNGLFNPLAFGSSM